MHTNTIWETRKQLSYQQIRETVIPTQERIANTVLQSRIGEQDNVMVFSLVQILLQAQGYQKYMWVAADEKLIINKLGPD